MTRIDICISDSIAVRCGCRAVILRRGKAVEENPACRATRQLEPDGRKWKLTAVVECLQCMASWQWGEP